MNEEVKEETQEETKETFVLTDELREKASQKQTFNILYVGNGDSRLSPFRGESMIRTFSTFYERQANISYYTASSKRLSTLTIEDLRHVNILWLDNLSDFFAARNLSVIIEKLSEEIEPGWKEKIKAMSEKNPEDASKFANDLRKKRHDRLRIIYALDEFVWEGVVGRVYDIQTVQLIESYMNMADALVVPTGELREIVDMYGFLNPAVELFVIPTSVNYEFFPLYKNFLRKGKLDISQLRDKPKILVKGLTVPANVQEFIINNHKKMDITICSVGDVDVHIKGLIGRGKVKHIYHWANPLVNKSNIVQTCAIERDSGFDFVIHTKPDSMKGQLYEITTGDEDILFSVAYGALPISGIDHIGVEDDGNNLMNISGLTFGKDSSYKKIEKIISLNQTPSLFNEAFGKCRARVENRIVTSPFIIARYFGVMIGRDLAKARAAIAKEKQAEMEKAKEEKAKAKESRERKDVRSNSDAGEPSIPEQAGETDFPEVVDDVMPEVMDDTMPQEIPPEVTDDGMPEVMDHALPTDKEMSSESSSETPSEEQSIPNNIIKGNFGKEGE